MQQQNDIKYFKSRWLTNWFRIQTTLLKLLECLKALTSIAARCRVYRLSTLAVCLTRQTTTKWRIATNEEKEKKNLKWISGGIPKSRNISSIIHRRFDNSIIVMWLFEVFSPLFWFVLVLFYSLLLADVKVFFGFFVSIDFSRSICCVWPSHNTLL